MGAGEQKKKWERYRDRKKKRKKKEGKERNKEPKILH